jgi:hypothetical protein
MGFTFLNTLPQAHVLMLGLNSLVLSRRNFQHNRLDLPCPILQIIVRIDVARYCLEVKVPQQPSQNDAYLRIGEAEGSTCQHDWHSLKHENLYAHTSFRCSCVLLWNKARRLPGCRMIVRSCLAIALAGTASALSNTSSCGIQRDLQPIPMSDIAQLV